MKEKKLSEWVIIILIILFLPQGVGKWFEKLYDNLRDLLKEKISFLV
jgi:uncharacterized membrane protein